MAFKGETITVATTATKVAPTGIGGNNNYSYTFTVPDTPAIYAGGPDVTSAANSRQLVAGSIVSGSTEDGTLYLAVASGTTDIDVLFAGV